MPETSRKYSKLIKRYILSFILKCIFQVLFLLDLPDLLAYDQIWVRVELARKLLKIFSKLTQRQFSLLVTHNGFPIWSQQVIKYDKENPVENCCQRNYNYKE